MTPMSKCSTMQMELMLYVIFYFVKDFTLIWKAVKMEERGMVMVNWLKKRMISLY